MSSQEEKVKRIKTLFLREVVRFKKLVPEARIPTRGSVAAAGLDLYSIEAVTLKPGEYQAVRTGLAMALPHGYEGQIRPRSGWALNFGITVLNSPGTIDCDFRGEVKVLLINHSQGVFAVKPGERMAQLVVSRVEMMEAIDVQDLDQTDRGSGGWGSTGR